MGRERGILPFCVLAVLPAPNSGASMAWAGTLLPWVGCERQGCSGHGECMPSTPFSYCECDRGWNGQRCDIDSCPPGLRTDVNGQPLPDHRHCSGRGLCLAGKSKTPSMTTVSSTRGGFHRRRRRRRLLRDRHAVGRGSRQSREREAQRKTNDREGRERARGELLIEAVRTAVHCCAGLGILDERLQQECSCLSQGGLRRLGLINQGSKQLGHLDVPRLWIARLR